MKKLKFFLLALPALLSFAACHTNNKGVNNTSDSSMRAIKESAYDTSSVGQTTNGVGSGAGTGVNKGGSGTNTGGATNGSNAPGTQNQ